MGFLEIFIVNNIIIIILILLIVGYGFYIRNRLFALWHEVSRLELIFNKKLLDTMKLYLKKEQLLEGFPFYKSLQIIAGQENIKFRHIKLEERQKIFKTLQKIFGDIYHNDNPDCKPLKTQFESLQMTRLKYNSKVLLYNQKIHTFPTKFFAKKMRFLPKQYFG